ncbi:hypothetical protein Ancab_008553 [Ancistrocladus abbreviatus]
MEGGMTTHTHAIDAAVHNKIDAESRPIANFRPDVWGDYYLNYTPDDEETKALKAKQLEELKEEVRKELLAVADESLELLDFIDAIQRLGVAYHFEEEIEDALQRVYDNYKNENFDLYYTSLQFRLLRQHGFFIPYDVFNKFIDKKENFNECIKSDIRGILSLYEASHLRTKADLTLDKALEFTTSCLKSVDATQLSEPLGGQVLHALEQPLHKGMTRLESRHYITFYEQDASHNKTLLKFAKLDFNSVLSLYKEELRYCTRWWRSLNAVETIPVRERVAEAFFWIVGATYEPHYYISRIAFFKVFMVVTIIDDIYDAYGTIEELELLTKAIDRWDYNCLNDLPEYMKVGYKPTLDIYDEFEELVAKEGKSDWVKYAREEMKLGCRKYLVEARWRSDKHFPMLDEYLNDASIISLGYKLAAITCYLGMREANKEDAFEWVSKNPNIINSANIVGRLLNDMSGHKFEHKRDHVSSAVHCCIRQYGVTEEKALQELNRRVTDAWKDVNQAMLRPHVMPRPLLNLAVNLCRAVEVIYKDEDTYTNPDHTMKNNIALIMTDPIPI